jgi:hypothetical protein
MVANSSVTDPEDVLQAEIPLKMEEADSIIAVGRSSLAVTGKSSSLCFEHLSCVLPGRRKAHVGADSPDHAYSTREKEK